MIDLAVANEPVDLLVEPVVRTALLEDLGRAGDLTTDAIVAPDARATAHLVVRKAGRVAGLRAALFAFRLLDPGLAVEVAHGDGADVSPGERIATLTGRARALLSAERTALNFLCRLSGIATATQTLVQRVRNTPAQIVCTRKTTPGLRVLEKYAVRVGGGRNHRFGLDDAVLIKDNHLIAAGGIAEAVARVRSGVGHLVKIELEVDSLEQLRVALATDVDAILLD
ncbi:MAG: carboxylating nicotinate-nucleotide diphosphorylase, partial [Vulcanimicrobiaceae bacterium]